MADSSSSSSSEETPSETVAALFPIFLVAILSCFLFPITQPHRRRGGRHKNERRRRRRRKRDDDKDEDKDDGKKERQHFSRHSNQSQRLFVGEIVRTIGPPIATVDEKTDVFQRVEFSDRSRMDSFLPALILGEIHANRGEEV